MTARLEGCELPLVAIDPPAELLLAPLGRERLGAHADGLDLILEGFLLHHGRPRLAWSEDADTRLLAGDWCYARGLVEVSEAADLGAIDALARLIALSSALVAEGRRGELARLWTATAGAIGSPDDARRALAAALEDAESWGDAVAELAADHPAVRSRLMEVIG